MKIKKIFIPLRIVPFSLLSLFFLSCNRTGSEKVRLILEEKPSGSFSDFQPGSRLCELYPGDPGSLRILTSEFYSACSPDISFDGRMMVFSAQQKQNEVWQIWEMDLAKHKFRRITTLNENCTDPAYLPGNRIVFSKMTQTGKRVWSQCLFTCNIDGSGLSQITFSPTDNTKTLVLKDGRLLTVNIPVFPEKGAAILMVMRPDGTKAELFYKNTTGRSITTGAIETDDGRIMFIEAEPDMSAPGRIVSVSYNRPLHSTIDFTSDSEGDFRSVLPAGQGKYYISWRQSSSENYSLFEYDGKQILPGREIISDPGFNITGTLLTGEKERPKKLPSEVDTMVKTGLLLCEDINFLNPFLPDIPGGNTMATKIEVLGIDTTYGVVKAEQDGSFQLKVVADKPFRIRTLDESGSMVNGPGSWIWLRPNERRGCIGCHEDPELAPRNKTPMAILKSPVMVPVHVLKVNEKTVELE